MRTSLAQRALTSIRWRSGLNTDLDQLRSRIERVERTVLPAAELALPVAGDQPADLGGAALSTRGSTKAWATAADADLLEEILSALAARFGGVLRVLEWGSGLSTLHYPEWLTRQGVRVSWTTLEYDRDLFRRSLEPVLRERGATIVWSEDLSSSSGLWLPDRPGVTAVVFDKGSIDPFDGNPMRYADRAKDLDEYVVLPTALGLRFHAAIVDGRKRRRCLGEAASVLEDNGVALLHDAQRPYYRSAFAAFRSGRRVGDEFWIGAQADTDFSDLVPPDALASLGLDYVPCT